MITTLHIKNIGIIDDLNIELGEGFNVLTGETGAGKTLIIDAINIICGGRFSKEIIRNGENFSFVELSIFLPENVNLINENFDINTDIDRNIIISREINNNGRNSCRINGRLATVSELKEFMSNIIDIHGQNDNQKILDNKYHIKYLDDFCGNDIDSKVQEYKSKYKRYVEIKKELKENLGDDKEKQRRLDLLQYEFDEIDKANLKDGEEDRLKEKSKLIENAEKIVVSLNSTNENCKSAVDCINNAIKSMDKIANVDEKYNNKLSELKSIYYEIDEFTRDIEESNDELYFDDNERNEVETRLDLIYSLKRKYGNSIEEIINYKDKIEEEIENINNLDEKNNKLKEELKLIEKDMDKLSKELHEIRVEKAQILNTRINQELKDLEMGKAEFITQINEVEKFNSRGKDDIEFYWY